MMKKVKKKEDPFNFRVSCELREELFARDSCEKEIVSVVYVCVCCVVLCWV